MNKTKDITIRGFESGDAREVSQLIIDNLISINSRDFGEEAAGKMASFYSPQLLLEYARNGNIYVAVEHSEVVGTAELDQDRVRNVFVRIDHHQQGIGKLLMQYIEDLAGRQGKVRLGLKAGISAVDFYQKLGYAIVREIDEPMGDVRIHVVEMEKPLAVVSFREQGN